MTDRKRIKGKGLPPDWVEVNKVDPALQANLLGRMEEFFHRLGGGGRPAPAVARWEDLIIEKEIPVGASVLDLGCGDGTLLRRLIDTRRVRSQGVEVDPANVARCVAVGAPVFQVDVEEGLRGLDDNSFDYVILEETLQTLTRPVETLREMLRVGRRGIVS
ncbi:MAG: methyltransferase domain-containing protein, partial [Nitrospinae bacterium]|nr:methyltransferase domain-containing protein [Nitrospinota bacterium]